jgi:hypothetical protein
MFNIVDDHINNVIDRKSVDVDYFQILSRLSGLKCRLLQTFGVSEGGYYSTHMLIATPQGQEAIMLTPRVACEEVIVCVGTSALLVPMAIREFFLNNFKKDEDYPISGVFCFLSHQGIDAMDNPSGNCVFEGGERTLQKIGKGMKFYQALPLFKYEELVGDEERDNLQTFIGNARQIQLFKQMIFETGLFNLLNSDGPYTIFAPSDTAIISKYGKNYEALKAKGLDYEKSFVLSHIFPGRFGKDFFGSLLNMNGDEVLLKNGVIEDVTNVLEEKCKYNGNVCIMKHVMEPKKVKTYEGRTPSKTISMMDIAYLTYRLWQIQNSYDLISLKSIEDQLAIMTKKLQEFRENVEKMDKVGNDILTADSRYRDIIHEHETSGNLETGGINARLAVLLKQYNKHMETSARINAAEQLLALITKIVRDA